MLPHRTNVSVVIGCIYIVFLQAQQRLIYQKLLFNYSESRAEEVCCVEEGVKTRELNPPQP